jgi:hypothetical protein
MSSSALEVAEPSLVDRAWMHALCKLESRIEDVHTGLRAAARSDRDDAGKAVRNNGIGD